MEFAGKARRILFLVENLPSPFDRRVWQEATTLRARGYEVSIICPTGKGYEARYEVIEGVHIYRYNLPMEAEGAKGYLIEYSAALFHTFRLAFKVWRERGFDAIHACNPPDLLFLIAGFFKLLWGTRFVFDHHDINPELYEAKFGRRDLFYKLMLLLERLTFRTADISIATNESYRRIATGRAQMDPRRVFVVRSGPKIERMRRVDPVPAWRKGRQYLVGYVGVMGKQEGIDLLLQAAQDLIVRQGRDDIQFALVGDGTALSEMRAYAESLGIADYITFVGRVPDAILLEVLNTADVCVNPDVANDMNDKSTMNKIMEYMALSKPIVQFDLTEGRFSAQDASLYAKPNDFVDFGEKISDLLADATRRKVMGELGRARIENALEWRYEAPKLLAAYEALWHIGSATPPSARPALQSLGLSAPHANGLSRE